MTQPCQHLRNRDCDLARRQCWSVYHDNAQAQRAGGVYFGRGPYTACIFGDDMGDLMVAQQGCIASKIEGPTRNDDAGLRQEHIAWRVHQPQQVMVLRFGGKCFKVLLANRQKYPRGRIGQGGNGTSHIRDVHPIIARNGLPRRSLQCQQLHTARKACLNGILAHLGCKWVGGINDMGDAILAQILTQSSNTPKTADAHGQRLGHRAGRAACIGKHGINAPFAKCRGKRACLSGTAQQECAHG